MQHRPMLRRNYFALGDDYRVDKQGHKRLLLKKNFIYMRKILDEDRGVTYRQTEKALGLNALEIRF